MVTTTATVGRAMLEVIRHGASTPIIEQRQINELGARYEREHPTRT
jgi:hypothetical protein